MVDVRADLGRIKIGLDDPFAWGRLLDLSNETRPACGFCFGPQSANEVPWGRSGLHEHREARRGHDVFHVLNLLCLEPAPSVPEPSHHMSSMCCAISYVQCEGGGPISGQL